MPTRAATMRRPSQPPTRPRQPRSGEAAVAAQGRQRPRCARRAQAASRGACCRRARSPRARPQRCRCGVAAETPVSAAAAVSPACQHLWFRSNPRRWRCCEHFHLSRWRHLPYCTRLPFAFCRPPLQIDKPALWRACGDILETLGHLPEAADLFERCGLHERAATIHIAAKNFAAAAPLMAKVASARLQLAYAKAREAQGRWQEAAAAYEAGGARAGTRAGSGFVASHLECAAGRTPAQLNTSGHRWTQVPEHDEGLA